MDNPVNLLAASVTDSAPNYAKITPAHLDLPTPCEGWDLRALLNHVLSRVELSTRAAKQDPVADFAEVEIDYLADNPAAAVAAMTESLVDAWSNTDDLTTPRVTPMGPLPPEAVLLFGAQDLFIHAWDVARTIGEPPELSDEMIAVFTETHRQSVDADTRAMFFGPEIPIADDAPPLDQLVAFLGRKP